MFLTMDKMKTVIAAAIVAVGIVVLGFCIKADRKSVV